MAEEGTPREFKLEGQNEVVRIEDISLHHEIEVDKDGRAKKHVWIEAVAVPEIDRDSMSVDLHFILFAEDERLGKCCRHGLEIDDEQEKIDVKADSDLRVAQNVEVSKIELALTVTTINSFKGIKLDPAPFPSLDKGTGS